MGKNKRILVHEIEHDLKPIKDKLYGSKNHKYIDCRCGDRVKVYKDSDTNCPSCGNNIKFIEDE